MSTTVVQRCPAKVNLALSVGRPDADGMHPIASWMIAVSLMDELTIERTEGESSYEIAWAEDAPQPSPIDWPLERDLAVRAHRRLERAVGRSLPLRMTLAKRIPVGAGLAGGSTDAAGMLQAANRVYDLQLTDGDLRSLAGELGSDVAFFFAGGAALVTGRGETVEPVAGPARLALLLILPDLHCPTGAVYRRFDALRPDAAVNQSAVEALIRANPLPADALFNDLAKPACRVEPRLADLHERIERTLLRPLHVTGSGAGLFIAVETADEAAALALQLQRRVTVPTRVVEPL